MGTLDPRLGAFRNGSSSGARAATATRFSVDADTLAASNFAGGAPVQGGGTENVQAPPMQSIIVHCASSAAAGSISAIDGVQVRSTLDNMFTANATRDGLSRLEQSPDVVYIEGAKSLRPTEAKRGAKPVIEMPRTPLAQTGSGVIVGIVDWGCDFTHPDFCHSDGSTRLLSIWDQSGPSTAPGRPPQGYTTGFEYDSDAINQALKSSNPFGALGMAPPLPGAHGTHVMGIAAGNGGADPSSAIRGIAPDADLIFVQPDTSDVTAGRGLGDSTHLVEAIKYIFDKASALRRPAVVNLSMGTNSGPHDGCSLVEQWVDRLLTVPGRAVVLALGNQHNERFNRTHSDGHLEEGEQTTLYWRVLEGDRSANEIEIWYSGRDVFSFEVELPDGSRLPKISGDYQRTDVVGVTPMTITQTSMVHTPINGDNHYNVIVDGGSTNPIAAGVWQIHLTAIRSRDGDFDAWIERDTMVDGARMSAFLGGSYVRRKTLGSLQSARNAITVSNYDAMTTTLADSTSFGPTRDGRHAPTVAAPGVDIMAPNALWKMNTQNTFPYIPMTGTSMSSPYVAGIVACMFEKNPRLTASQIRAILAAEAKPAPGISDAWVLDWGYGRVDACASLDAIP